VEKDNKIYYKEIQIENEKLQRDLPRDKKPTPITQGMTDF
jgi:hypothetical protein